jgi:FkbM family methyltransferase
MLIKLSQLNRKYNLKISGILHVGASIGQEAEQYKALGVKNVIWVEAIPNIYEDLKKNIAAYPGNKAIHECVSDTTGEEVDFNVSDNEAQSSSMLQLGVHEEIHPEVHYVSSFKTTTKRIDDIVREYDIDMSAINMLNFDIQGAELQALKGMGDLIGSINYIYLEVNKRETYKGCALIDEVDSFLVEKGFKRVETGEWVEDCWTDAFYVRTECLSNVNNSSSWLSSIVSDMGLKVNGIIEIGAYKGGNVEDYEPLTSNIVLLEPITPNFKHLQDNYTGKARMINVAAGEYEGWGSMNTYADDSLNSFCQVPGIEKTGSVSVEMSRLDRLKLDVGLYNILIIDVNGYELEVLKGAIEFLQYIKCVCIKTSAYHKELSVEQCQKLTDAIYALLKQYGFGFEYNDSYWLYKKQ